MRPAMSCALVLAALSGAACHVKRPVTLEQLVVIKPERAWVTQADQSVVLLTGPLNVAGDTLQGYLNGTFEEIPGSRLKQVIVQRSAPGRTVALSVAVGVGLVGFAYALTGGGGRGVEQSDTCDKHPELPQCANGVP